MRYRLRFYNRSLHKGKINLVTISLCRSDFEVNSARAPSTFSVVRTTSVKISKQIVKPSYLWVEEVFPAGV